MYLAGKIAVSSVLAYVIAYAVGFREPADFAWFAPFSVIINLIMYPHQTWYRNIMVQRLMGVSLGAGIAFAGSYFLGWSPPLYIAYLTIMTLIFAYQVGAHHRLHYLFFLAFIFVDLLGCFYLLDPAVYSSSLWHFPLMVVIAMVAIFAVDLILPGNILKRVLSDMVEESCSIIQQTLKDYPHKIIDEEWFYYVDDSVGKATYQIKHENRWTYRHRIHLLRIIAVKINYIINLWNEQKINDRRVQEKIAIVFQIISQYLEKIKKNESYQITELEKNIAELQEFINAEHEANELAFHCVLHELKLLSQDFSRIDEQPVSTAVSQPLSLYSKFDKNALVFSLRVTLTVAITVFGINYFGLEGEYQTLIAGIVIAAAPHTGALLFKSAMRALGIIVGGMTGALFGYFLLGLDNIYVLLAPMLVMIFLFSWFAARFEYYAYAGIQAALLFVIILLGDMGQQLDYELGMERFIGIFIGGFFALMVNFLIAPELPRRRIKHNLNNIISKLSNYLDKIFVDNSHSDRQKIIDDLDKLLNAVKNDIDMSNTVGFNLRHLSMKVVELKRIGQQIRRIQRIEDFNCPLTLLKELENLTNRLKKRLNEIDLYSRFNTLDHEPLVLPTLDKEAVDIQDKAGIAKLMLCLQRIDDLIERLGAGTK